MGDTSRRRWGGLLLAAAFALFARCAASRPATRHPDESAAGRRRAVLASFDGVGGQRLSELLARQGALPAGGYRRVAARGLYALYSIPPTPSLTAVAHVTHVTGALPQVMGIVANTLRDFSGPFGTTISGFAAPIRAETLWQAARRQGRRTGSILYPGADGASPDRSADFGMAWPGDPIFGPKLHVLEADAWRLVEGPPAEGFSESRRVTVDLAGPAQRVALTALDGTDDGRVNYDRMLVETPAGPRVVVKPGDWFPAELAGNGARTGAWCKLLVLGADLSRSEVYVGAVNRSHAYPEDFLRVLDAELGFWPGTPDEIRFGARSARPEVFLEQAERISDFITRAQLLAIHRGDWDLMLLYNPVADETGHEFLLVDPRQAGYTADRSRRLTALADHGYTLADGALARIDAALSPDDSLFVTSDHGMTPLWAEIFPNEILRAAGFVLADADGAISPDSRAFAVVSSGNAHVHVNPSADAAAVLPAIEKLFRAFRADGESPWEVIVTRDAAGALGLRAPESGDLILIAKPGIAVGSSLRPGKGPTGIPAGLGGHGYVNVHPRLHASFLAAGPRIPVRRVAEVRSWEIAARVAGALGMEPPRQAASPRP